MKVTAVVESTSRALYCRTAAFPVVIVTAEVLLTLHKYEDTVPSSSVAVPVSVPEVPSLTAALPVMLSTAGGMLAATLFIVTS